MDQNQTIPTFQSFQTNSPPRNNNKISPTIVVGAIILILAIGTFLIIGQTKKSKDEVKEETKITTESKEPSPTSKPVVDKKTVKIQVINGTGTPGQAGEVVKSLEEAGYETDNIKTGNADEFDNETTIIEVKENFEDIASDIKDTLKSTFDKITIKTSNLEADSEFDVVITTGGKIYVTATPVLSPTSSTATPTVTPGATSTPTTTPTPTP